METETTFREKAAETLTSPAFILTAILLISIFTVLYGGVMAFAGLAVCLITFWATKWDWSFFGISKPDWGKTLIKASLITALLYIATEILEAVLEIALNAPIDFSGFKSVEGDLTYFLLLLVIGWSLAAVGEEVFYRGYVMKRIAAIFGDGRGAQVIGVIISSVLFGLSRNHQGVTGIISAGLFGLVCALVLLKNPHSLVLCMLIHGLTDTIGTTCLYMGWDPVTAEMLQKLF